MFKKMRGAGWMTLANVVLGVLIAAINVSTASAQSQIPVFSDIPYDSTLRPPVEAIYRAGITSGCASPPFQYCPGAAISRSQMAVFLVRAVHGAAFVPNASNSPNPYPGDVTTAHPFYNYIIQAYIDGMVAACATGSTYFCPDSSLIRDTAAQFMMLGIEGGSYVPPPPTPIFADVPIAYPLASWIDALYNAGLTQGCLVNPLRYCPTDVITRGAMALLITRGFDMPPSVYLRQVMTVSGQPSSVQLEATTWDFDDAVTKVEFFDGAASLCVFNNPSASQTCAWTAPSGTHNFTARATDTAGNTRLSAPAIVATTPNASPTVTLTSPASGAVPQSGSTISLAATASDALGISRVEFLVANDVFAPTTAPPYTGSITNVPPGLYSIVARAVNNAGLMKTSAPATLTVCGAPQVALMPVDGSVFTAPASVPLAATVTVATGCGPVQKVEFMVNGAVVNTDTSSPFAYSWSGSSAGPYALTARAYDVFSQPGDSPTNTISLVSNNHAPAITSVTPPTKQIALGGSLDFDVVATDQDVGDTITVLLKNTSGTVVATGTPTGGNHYTLSYTPLTALANVSFAVVARDSHLTESAPQNVTVSVIAAVASAAPNPSAVIPPGAYVTPATGMLAGSFAVTDSGSASYSIPIQVPPGTAGMQPNLSLTYSSQGGNGLVGIGWALSGLSQITRCSKTEAQDGSRDGINYDSSETNDVFCLDGQRLVKIASSNVTDNWYGTSTPAVQVEYRMESETYSRIIGYQYQPGTGGPLFGPYRWTIYTKSGEILQYGSHWWILSAGFLENQYQRWNTGKVWVLDRVEDRSGNFMEIDYADRNIEAGAPSPNVLPLPRLNCGGAPHDPGLPPSIGAFPNVEYWPTMIRYYAAGALGAQCGNSPNNQVHFVYEDAPNQLDLSTRDRYYDAGAGQTTLSKRLVRIETAVDAPTSAAGGTPVTRYNLAYTTSQQSKRSLLASVTQCTAETVAKCLPSTSFEWASKDYNAQGKKFAGPHIASLPFGLSGAMVGDWNGDGRSDILGWRNLQSGLDSGGQPIFSHQFYVCLAAGSGATQGFDCGNPLFGLITDSNQTAPYGIQLADLNGDGRVDLAWKSGSTAWTVCMSTGDKNSCSMSALGWSTPSAGSNPVFQGDMDGDGRLDIVTYMGNNRFQTCFARDNGFQCVPTQDLTITTACPPSNPGCEAFTGASVQYDVLIADVNGDGRADLIRRRVASADDSNDNDEWKVCFSQFQPTSSTAPPSGGYACHQQFVHGQKDKTQNNVLFDFNGDGIADMANYYDEGGVQAIRVCLSTGDGAFEFTNVGVHWDPVTSQWLDDGGGVVDFYTAPRCRLWNSVGQSGVDKVAFGDFNGDGRTDALRYVSGTTWNVCLSTGSDFACSTWAGPNLSATNPDLNQKVVFGDFDGDGRTDMLRMDTLDPFVPTTVTADLGLAMGATAASARPGDVVTKITTGLGATTGVGYAPLTDATVYARATTADLSHREIDIQSPMYVVKNTDASTGYNPGVGALAPFHTDYFYEGLRGRTDGRGLYGFAKKRSRDSNGLVTEMEYYRTTSGTTNAASWPVMGRPSAMRKYAPTSAGYIAPIDDVATFANAAAAGSTLIFANNLALVGQSNNTWQVQTSRSCTGSSACVVSPTIKESSLTQTVAKTWELNGSLAPLALPAVTTSSPITNLDAYGNQASVVVSTPDGYSKTTTSTFGNDAVDWVNGKLLKAVVDSVKPGAVAGQRVSSFAYKGFNSATCSGAAIGQLCVETIQPDSPLAGAGQCASGGAADCVTTLYEYDAFGNRSKTTIQLKDSDGSALSDRVTMTTYGTSNGDNGRFPTTVSNGLGQSESRGYDHGFGKATVVTGPNGMTTTTSLDGFGRTYGERIYDSNGSKIRETFSPVESGATANLQAGEIYRTRVLVSGGSESISYFDELQREVRVQSRAFTANAYAQATVKFDYLGHKIAATKPTGSGTVTTSWIYDVLNRVKNEASVGAAVTLSAGYTYGTFATLTIDGATVSGGQQVTVAQSGTGLTARSTVKYSNSQNQTVRVHDAAGGDTDYSYDAYGNLIKVIGPNGGTAIAEVMTYDRRGRKITLNNPDSGNWTYAYNGANELSKQTDAKGQVTRMFYDVLGRTIERREHPGNETTTPFVTVWTFDAYADASSGSTVCSNGVGKACEVRTATVARSTVGDALPAAQTRRVMQYDAAGRVAKSVDQVDGRSFVNATSFDANGRVDKLMYPSGYMVVSRYTAWSGQMDQVAQWAGAVGTVHWQANSRNNDGQIDTMLVGGQTTSKSYDGFGRVATIHTGGVTLQNASYGYDALGNLTSRADPATSQASQAPSYDLLNRLTGTTAGSLTYNASGNLMSRPGQTYAYYSGTHRLQTMGATGYTYDVNGNVTNITGGPSTRTIVPNAYNLPTSITSSSATLTYVYDSGHARIKEVSQSTLGTATTYYLGSYEEHLRGDGVLEQRHYVTTPEGAVGMVTLRSNGAGDVRYWHKDHLGSIAVIVDGSGVVKQKFTYDEWGNRGTVTQTDPTPEERGYTGHELLTEVGIVHMNGRLYDPATGRMLSADPLVQDPFNGQNYNRYAYVLNNPLSLTDPTGFSFWTKWRRPIIAIAASVVTAGIASELVFADAVSSAGGFLEAAEVPAAMSQANAVGALAGGFAAGGIQGGNIESAVAGALFAFTNFGIGEITGHGPAFGTDVFFQNVGLHAAAGCAQQTFAGGSCKGGAAAAGFSALAGPLSSSGPGNLLTHIAIGATASRLAGGSAQDGAITAAFDYLFNETAVERKFEMTRDSGFHQYETEPAMICNNSEAGCSMHNVGLLLPSWSLPGKYGVAVQDGEISYAGFGMLVGGLVRTEISSDRLVVTNTTTWLHTLNPGSITRTLIQTDEGIFVRTIGIGWGNAGAVNSYFGRNAIFPTLDFGMRRAFCAKFAC